MAPFEMILLVVVGDIVQQGVTQEDFSLTGAVLAASTIAFWVTVLSYASWRWAPVGRAIDGVPLVIVQHGRPVTDALRVERLPLAEVLEEARQHGITSLAATSRAVPDPTTPLAFLHPSPPHPPHRPQHAPSLLQPERHHDR